MQRLLQQSIQTAPQEDQPDPIFQSFSQCRPENLLDIAIDIFLFVNGLVVILLNVKCFFQWYNSSQKAYRTWVCIFLVISSILIVVTLISRYFNTSIRFNILLMMCGQYFFLCTLTVLLLLMAYRYKYFRSAKNLIFRRSMFLLVPLHILFVWAVTYSMVTHYGGFCTAQSMFPTVVFLTNGLAMILFIVILVLSIMKYQVDIKLKDLCKAHVDRRKLKSKMLDRRTNRLLFFGIWCALLTCAFLSATTLIFHKTDSLQCSADGEHFVFLDCNYSSLVHLISALATIHFSAVFRVVFFRVDNKSKLHASQDIRALTGNPIYTSESDADEDEIDHEMLSNRNTERERRSTAGTTVPNINRETDATGPDNMHTERSLLGEEEKTENNLQMVTECNCGKCEECKTSFKVSQRKREDFKNGTVSSQMSFGAAVTQQRQQLAGEECSRISEGSGSYDEVTLPQDTTGPAQKFDQFLQSCEPAYETPLNGGPDQNQRPSGPLLKPPSTLSRLNLQPDEHNQSAAASSARQSITSSQRRWPNLTIQTRPEDQNAWQQQQPNGSDANLLEPINDRSPIAELRRCGLNNKHIRPDCCTFGLFYSDEDMTERLVPIQSVNSSTTLQGGYAFTTVTIVHYNPDQSKARECTYEYPIQDDLHVVKLSFQFNYQHIDTRVQKQAENHTKKPDEIYREKKQYMAIDLGKLHPQKQAIIRLQLVSSLPIQGSAYMFKLHESLYPNYQKHSQVNNRKVTETHPYDFQAKIVVKSDRHITYLSKPQRCDSVKQNMNEITMIVTKPTDEIKVYYKIVNMQIPEILYGKSQDHPGEAAWSLSLTPHFQLRAKQKPKTEIAADEPTSTVLLYGNHLHFIFLVDRGNTMQGPQMEAVKDAVELFLRSLPINSKFSVLGFGNQAQFIDIKGQSIIDMNEDTLVEAIKVIKAYQANYGSKENRNILKPLQQMIDQSGNAPKDSRHKKIFILTDGDIDFKNQNEVAKLVQKDPNVCFHTFGVGQLCKRQMVQDLATVGGGHCSILESIDNTNELEDRVEQALALAIEPSLRNCELQYEYHGKVKQTEDLRTIFRHQLIQRQYISPLVEFIGLKIKFNIGMDTFTKKPENHEQDVKEFTEVSEQDAPALFLLAAHAKIQQIQDEVMTSQILSGDFGMSRQEQNEISVKYQTLSDYTTLMALFRQVGDENTEVPFYRKNFRIRTPKQIQKSKRTVDVRDKELIESQEKFFDTDDQELKDKSNEPPKSKLELAREAKHKKAMSTPQNELLGFKGIQKIDESGNSEFIQRQQTTGQNSGQNSISNDKGDQQLQSQISKKQTFDTIRNPQSMYGGQQSQQDNDMSEKNEPLFKASSKMPQLDFKKNSNGSSRYDNGRDSFGSSEVSILSSQRNSRQNNYGDLLKNDKILAGPTASKQLNQNLKLQPEMSSNTKQMKDLELEIDALDGEHLPFNDPKNLNRHVTFAQKKPDLKQNEQDEAHKILFGDDNIKDSPQKEQSMPKGHYQPQSDEKKEAQQPAVRSGLREPSPNRFKGSSNPSENSGATTPRSISPANFNRAVSPKPTKPTINVNAAPNQKSLATSNTSSDPQVGLYKDKFASFKQKKQEMDKERQERIRQRQLKAEEQDRNRKFSASPGGARTPGKLSFVNTSPHSKKSPLHIPDKSPKGGRSPMITTSKFPPMTQQRNPGASNDQTLQPKNQTKSPTASSAKRSQFARSDNGTAVFSNTNTYQVPVKGYIPSMTHSQKNYNTTPPKVTYKEPTKAIDISLHTDQRTVSPRRNKPELRQVIEHQAIGGEFRLEVEGVLKQFFRGGSVIDTVVMLEFENLMSQQGNLSNIEGYSDKAKRKSLYLTLVACHVFEWEFFDRQNEWNFDAGKAIKKLQMCGLTGTAVRDLLDKFSLDFAG